MALTREHEKRFNISYGWISMYAECTEKDLKLFGKQLILYPNKTQDTHVFSQTLTHYHYSNV